jgi:GLPGLI family protein
MKTKIFFLLISFFLFFKSEAQHFINKAVIEYEVRANVKKTMGSDAFEEMIKDKLPQFKTAYYTYTFAHGKSIYKFDHWNEDKMPEFVKRWYQSEESNIWYYNYNNDKCDIQKNIYGTNLLISDSIPKLNWKLSNENRMIAGFNCRKAEAIIFDSVYVFAFYTEEITIPGGPASFHGLPGMILGITVPRLYTSWIATKVNVTSVNENEIKPLSQKKSMDYKQLEALMKDRTKDWYYSDDADENKEAQQQKARFIWGSLL